MNDTTGQIIDLAEEKVYDLDLQEEELQGHDLRRTAPADGRGAEEGRGGRAEGRRAREAEKPAAADPNAKQMEIDFDIKNTGEKKTINGFDTHEVGR